VDGQGLASRANGPQRRTDDTDTFSEAMKSNRVDRVDRVAIELHLPASRQTEGGDALTREFIALVHRVQTMLVASTVWMVDM
jgi:hypothetical protein